MPGPELVSLADAASAVPDGSRLGVGGMTLYRRPVAMIRELLRGTVGDFELIELTGGFHTDLMVGAGRVARLRSCYVGLESFGLAPMFTAAATSGAFDLVEETEVTLALGLRAAQGGVEFLPHRGLLGTDLPGVRPDLRTVRSPYSQMEYLAVPPLKLDIAVLHVPEADRAGNLVLGGNHAIDAALAAVATTTIVTAERLVEALDPGVADISGRDVDLLVECPYGAAPTSCWPAYPLRGTHLAEYAMACAAGRFEAYLEAFLAADLPLTALGRIATSLDQGADEDD